MRRFSTALPTIFLLALILCPLSSFAQQAKVRSIVDGDTLKVSFEGRTELLRLIGIDAPERLENPKAWRDAERSQRDIKTILAMGEKASQYTKQILRNVSDLQLEFDIEPRDKFGRLLAYAYLPSGGMLNELLIQAGYVNLMSIPPNLRYAERFKKALFEARKNGRGLWSAKTS